MQISIVAARVGVFCAGAVLLAMASLAHADALTDKRWIHGSQDCTQNRDPPIEVFEFDSDTYLLRQNKCVHFEAPFIYVLFGKHTVFIQDTGATEDPTNFRCTTPFNKSSTAAARVG